MKIRRFTYIMNGIETTEDYLLEDEEGIGKLDRFLDFNHFHYTWEDIDV